MASHTQDLFVPVPVEEKHLCKKIKDLSRKRMRIKNSIGFNKTCINNDLLPKYTRIRLYDPALQETEATNEFRRKLVEDELSSKQTKLKEIETELSTQWKSLTDIVQGDTLLQFKRTLDLDIADEDRLQKTTMLSKLNRLYRGNMFLYDQTDKFVNLSQHELTAKQKEVLNLGLNCHLESKLDPTAKKMELELLYNATTKLEKDKKIEISEGFAAALKNEGHKNRSCRRKSLLSREHRDAITELKNNKDISIRKADKTNNYVLLDKSIYTEKLDQILRDTTKFEKITSDPTLKLKTKLNKLISTANSAVDCTHFNKLEGDFSPGYIYGNAKTHKNPTDPPLRPIISQVTTPSYPVAKKLNEILDPYLPKGYSINSTDELLSVLQSSQPDGILASLDVENLFTNVPIDATIDIILNHVYRNPTLVAPALPETIMKSMLTICTKEAPFKHVDGSLYRQIDGIAMGSPLGPCFANFYMANLEHEVLSLAGLKPNLYLRYVDDIFIVIKDEVELETLRCVMEERSVLKFTHEIGFNKLPFLDVQIESINGKFETSVFTKLTNSGECLNYQSECPDKYKSGVIFTLVNRAFKISSDWQKFENEVQRLEQIFTNNNFPMAVVDKEINKFLLKKKTPSEEQTVVTKINLFYKNQMSSNYKIDERVLTSIFKEKVKCVNENETLKLNIYYQNRKTRNMLLRNNANATQDPLRRSNVVYKLKCPVEECTLPNPCYIGSTQCTLAQRITNHVQTGSFRDHLINSHNIAPNRSHFLAGASIVHQLPDKRRLLTYEALCIKTLHPSINAQQEDMSGFLKLYHDIPSNEQIPPHAIVIGRWQSTNLPSLCIPPPIDHPYSLRNRR